MTEPILLQFIDKIYSKHHDYCVICLRTNAERRLEKPKHLNSFLHSINKPAFDQKNQLICYFCERQAAAAYRFAKAADLAIHAHNVMRWLQSNPGLRSRFKNKFYIHDFENHIFEDNINPTRLRSVVEALDCEARLQRQSLRSQLLQTDVLTVSTPSPEVQCAAPDISTSEAEIRGVELGNYTCPMPPRPGESSDLYVVPDFTTTPNIANTFQLIDEPEIKMESIIIFDDDDPIGTSTKTQETNTNNRINDDLNKNIDKAFKAIPIEKLIDNAPDEIKPVEQQENPTHFILHPIVFNSGMMTVPSLSATIINGQLMTTTGSNIVVETPKIALQTGENIDFISDPDKVIGLLSKLSHQDAGKVHILTMAYPELINLVDQPSSASDNTFVVNKKVKVNNSAVAKSVSTNIEHKNNSACQAKASDSHTQTEVGKKTKGPTLGSDRIDWEDKIPMDLISFVDSREKGISSNKRARRGASEPTLGFISSVTSLSEKPPDDVIDLC